MDKDYAVSTAFITKCLREEVIPVCVRRSRRAGAATVYDLDSARDLAMQCDVAVSVILRHQSVRRTSTGSVVYDLAIHRCLMSVRDALIERNRL